MSASDGGAAVQEASDASPSAGRTLIAAVRKLRAPSPYAAAVFGAFSLGVLFRTYELGHRSLWFDEAWRANLVSDFEPMRAGLQVLNMPPLFALSAHCVTKALGTSEIALRSIPWLFGVLGLFALFRVAGSFADRWAALSSLAILGVASTMVSLTRQFEHYAGDILFSILLVGASESVVREGRWRNWCAYAFVAILTAGFSYGAVFVAGAASIVLLWRAAGRREWLKYFTVHAAVGAAFLSIYLLFTEAQVRYSEGYAPSWTDCFPDTSSAGLLAKCFAKIHLGIAGTIFDAGGILSPVTLSIMLIAIGAAVVAKSGHRRFLAYLLLPLGLCLLASFLGKYPYGRQPIIFASPALCIAWGAGAACVTSAVRRSQGALVSSIIPCVLLVPHAAATGYILFPKPVECEEMRPVVAALEGCVREGDAIFVHCEAREAFDFYYDGPCVDTFREERHRDDRSEYLREIDEAMARGGRIWFVFSHVNGDEEEYHLRHIEKRGALLREIKAEGAAAYLFLVNEAGLMAVGKG